MNHRLNLLFLAAALVALLAAPVEAAGIAYKGEGYRLRLPRGFQRAPSSRGSELQGRIQALMSGSGLPLTGAPKARVFSRIGTDMPATLVVLQFRVPEGSGTLDGDSFNPDQLQRAWDVAVGGSGREAVRDVRKEKLNALHTGVKATLVESQGGGVTTSVRLAVTAAHGYIYVLAYDAPSGTEIEHADAWEGVLGGLRLVAPGRDWGLYMKYGGIVAGCLVLLLAGWWLVLRPRHGELHPGRVGKADTQIRSVDGIGTFQQHSTEQAAETPSFLRPKELTNPLDIDPFASEDSAKLDPLPVPSVGEDWDPENDPAFAFPEEDDVPARPQTDYNQELVPQHSSWHDSGSPGATPAAPPPPAPEPAADAEEDGDMDATKITRNLDALFGD
ncbi:MAG: hypothetical protein QNJ98_00535 [Planctomycetota bacterium]|nr:hypothetical protein [Planctomycetota bacterium]